jgi:glycyl-tRNA synthetase beta chain
MTADWLFEIGAEELPYKTCQSVLAQLRGKGTAEAPGLVFETLAAERLVGSGDGGVADAVAFAETRLKVMVAPRRIAVLVSDVPREQTAQTLRWRGPRADVAFGPDGAPTKAGAGFARGKGVTPEQLRREAVEGTEFVVAVIEAERRPAELVLPGVCRRLITSLQIPRGMRWGAKPPGADDYLRFSRPLRWLACVFAGKPVPFDFYDLRAGEVTQGHRVLGRPVIVDQASHYERHLREQHVIVDHDERRRLIVEGLDATAAKLGGRWSDPAGVLEENIYLAEWPSVHSGSFAERHLRLPSEVLITAMQAHQRYWPVEDAAGSLLPAFLYVSNADPAAAALITHGNERVLEGRLDDAEFSYDRDLAEGLEAMASRLGEVVFHAKLGSLADKSARLVALTQWLAGWVGRAGDAPTTGEAPPTGEAAAIAAVADQGLTVRVTGELPAAVIAAKYAKADLVSQVVIEFPSLQGRVGGVYAEKAGASSAVAQAIAEHYRPLSAVAPVPATLAGGLVAIAEKIDNIAGAWLAGEKPSGSRDPYGLRRAAMGIVRICLEYDLKIAPRTLASAALRTYAEPADRTRAVLASTASGADPEGAIAAFIWERLGALLLDEGLPFALVEAALGAAAPSGASTPATLPPPLPADPPRVAALARTFARVAGEAFFNDVVVAYTRPAALAARAEAEPGGVAAVADPALFAEEAEHALAGALAEVREPIATALSGGDVEAALRAAAALRPPVDRYFDAVLVMDKDPALRANRLAQLRQITSLLGSLGDFARLPVQQG